MTQYVVEFYDPDGYSVQTYQFDIKYVDDIWTDSQRLFIKCTDGMCTIFNRIFVKSWYLTVS